MDLLYNISVCGFKKTKIILIFGVLTPLSTIFQLYHWRPVLVVEEAGVPGENHRPWASNW